MKWKILLLTKLENNEIEDIYIKDRLVSDGNIVDIKWIDYDEKLDEEYDLIIRRNTWADTSDMDYWAKYNIALINRLKSKNIKTVNLEGLDGTGKGYLEKLYHKNIKVIPTTDDIDEALGWNCENYMLKTKVSYGSCLGQKEVSKENLKSEYSQKYLIQPKLDFKSEVQTYFINNKLMYVFEYIPYKDEIHDPIKIQLTEEEEKFVKSFVNLSDIEVGMKRIDFLRLNDDSLILLEMEDHAPVMSMEKLDEDLRNKVIDYYVEGIYSYLSK